MSLIRYHQAAEEELLREIAYLELQAVGLGRRFFSEVQKVEKRIAKFPESAPEIAPGIRKCILRTFRYSLVYAMEEDTLLVLAVAHHSRRPEYWVHRAGQGG